MATSKHPHTISIQPGERITAREYAALPDEPGWKTDLHQGVLVKLPLLKEMRHDWIVANLIAALHAFVMPQRLGRVSSEQVGYAATRSGERDETTYGPDVALVRTERIPGAQAAVARGEYAPAPDLLAEVVRARQLLSGQLIPPYLPSLRTRALRGWTCCPALRWRWLISLRSHQMRRGPG